MVPAYSGGNTPTFSRELRYELDRSLAWSYVTSGALGLAWLLLVQFGPGASPIIDAIKAAAPREWSVVMPDPLPVRVASHSSGAHAAGAAPSVGDAFLGSASGIAVDVGNTLRDVQTRSGVPEVDRGAKVVLDAGTPGAGSRVPSDRAFGDPLAAGENSIGSVRGGGLSTSHLRIAALPVQPSALPNAPARDMAALGDVVRRNESALNSCYVERGLAANAALAGTIRVSIAIAASGRVDDAIITERSWSGAGVAETESCIRDSIKRWRFSSGSASAASYGFAMNFTR
ncbi:MAG: AgmX/PglI C-terminal domain-containing protein [Gemmatimonadota bacterium]|nr:AgmX/PglI C-terminal domain-containing protein [Gemmatimonadota bacterium]